MATESQDGLNIVERFIVRWGARGLRGARRVQEAHERGVQAGGPDLQDAAESAKTAVTHAVIGEVQKHAGKLIAPAAPDNVHTTAARASGDLTRHHSRRAVGSGGRGLLNYVKGVFGR